MTREHTFDETGATSATGRNAAGDNAASSSPGSLCARQASVEDLPLAVQLLADALVSEPRYEYLLPGPDHLERTQRLAGVFSLLAEHIWQPYGRLWILDRPAATRESNQVPAAPATSRRGPLGAAAWLPTDTRPPSGAWDEVFRRAHRQFQWHSERSFAFDAVAGLCEPHEPHAVLHVWATAAGRQDPSELAFPQLHTSTALLERVLASCDDAGSACYTDSATPSAMPVLLGLGFRPLTSRAVPRGPRITPLWRPAGS